MSTRLLLDGQDLRSLMLRVREEMGPDATIVRAERVRTGGIAGFFAREHYELTVEVPDPPQRRIPRSRPAPPDGAHPSGTLAEPVGLAALLAAAEAIEAGPEVSTTSSAFAEVLASVQQITADRPEPEPPAADDPAAPAGDDPAAPDGDDLAAQGGADEAEAEAGVTEGEPVWTPTTPPRLDEANRPLSPPVPVAPQPADASAPAQVHPAPGPAEDHTGTTAAALLELGIPLRLLAGVEDPQAPLPLSILVRSFDRPPAVRLEPGALVVVAGPAELAVRTAVAMAHRAGLAAHDVVLAGDLDPLPGHGRRVQTAAAAARVRTRTPQDAPTVVALGVGGLQGAADLLAAFEPDQAWAAVDARLRGVELRRWLRAVGAHRPLDAVAAAHVFEAQSVGAVLNLGVPVGWLDGLPASPVVWAAVLAERLADDARWD